MDRKFPEKAQIEQLIRLSSAARACLESEAVILRERLDFPQRVRSSLSSNPATWMIGSLVSGMFASSLFRRRTPVAAPTKSRGAALGLLGLALTAAKPLAKVWLANQLKDWMMRSVPSASAQSPLQRSKFL